MCIFKNFKNEKWDIVFFRFVEESFVFNFLNVKIIRYFFVNYYDIVIWR